MTPKHLVLIMHYGETNGKVQVYSDNDIPVDMNTIVVLLYKRASVGGCRDVFKC